MTHPSAHAPATDRGAEPTDWVLALGTPGHEQTVAMRQLHGLLVRAAAHQVWRMRSLVDGCSPERVDEIANGAADVAMTTLLGKLHTFEGHSRFTTWAYKFALLQAASDVRQQAWRRQEVRLRDLDPSDLQLPDRRPGGPEQEAEALDLASAMARAMHECLTAYQRQIAVALLVDEVPIDVLAARLGTTRGALYKTVHVARTRLRAELTAMGYLDEPRATGAAAGQHTTDPAPEQP
ncbi:RNA polymerase sigma factor [Ornithinimicrobium tianjinense]|uniref:DNA-directed RNA polymerase sigma-70 factor n=1 Tax=Ornithinimicrobium tianjinense TaxID=1195761 RepID=A0A917BUS4_9MICO|nr:sigma-70 family RNA polymerase sigma factor [Ornithinimicrobium tianjinense]GGF58187.1 DNA-directed RNA polymerase sigma-70 factor [Ornithinimicrobium tianjinense]